MPTFPRALRSAIVGTGALAVPILLVIGIATAALGAVGEQLSLNMLIFMVGVIGLGLYSGNSGILSFGHAAFMGIAAYVTGLLTAPTAIKQQNLPNLPSWLMSLELPFAASVVVSLAVVATVSALFGLAFSRLSAGVTPIATFTMLLIVHVVVVGAKDFTSGSSTFYGVPASVNIPLAIAAVLAVVFVARLFKESTLGLRLQASREDEVAAQSAGIHVARARFIAWVVSAAVMALAGVLMAHELTAFSPKQFYITLQFTLVAMLVVGGQTTVTGAVIGTILVSVMLEVARRVEIALTGLQIGSFTLSNVFGLQEITLGAVIYVVMIWRRNGLFAFVELDEIVRKRIAGRLPSGQGS